MALTFFFAQFLGLLMIVLSASLFIHPKTYASILAAYRADRSAIYPFTFTGLVIGILIVLLHNVWNGGLLPILVSLIGWLIFLKCVALLVLPASVMNKMLKPFGSRRTYTIVAVIFLIVGLYLLLAGFGTIQ